MKKWKLRKVKKTGINSMRVWLLKPVLLTSVHVVSLMDQPPEKSNDFGIIK